MHSALTSPRLFENRTAIPLQLGPFVLSGRAGAFAQNDPALIFQSVLNPLISLSSMQFVSARTKMSHERRACWR